MFIKKRKMQGSLKKGKVINVPIPVLKTTTDSREERLQKAKALSKQITGQAVATGLKVSQIEKDVQRAFNEIKTDRSRRNRY